MLVVKNDMKEKRTSLEKTYWAKDGLVTTYKNNVLLVFF